MLGGSLGLLPSASISGSGPGGESYCLLRLIFCAQGAGGATTISYLTTLAHTADTMQAQPTKWPVTFAQHSLSVSNGFWPTASYSSQQRQHMTTSSKRVWQPPSSFISHSRLCLSLSPSMSRCHSNSHNTTAISKMTARSKRVRQPPAKFDPATKAKQSSPHIKKNAPPPTLPDVCLPCTSRRHL